MPSEGQREKVREGLGQMSHYDPPVVRPGRGMLPAAQTF
jgi:hypothetical protein